MIEHCDGCSCDSLRYIKLLDWMDGISYYRTHYERRYDWSPLSGKDIRLIVDEVRNRLGKEKYLKLVPKAAWADR